VVIVYLIIRNEIDGAHAIFFFFNSTDPPVKFELGFWLLVGAVASRLLSAVPIVFSAQLARTEPGIQKSLRDTHNVDDVFYDNLTSKTASIIKKLRHATQTYKDKKDHR
jgi:hypothetical protein